MTKKFIEVCPWNYGEFTVGDELVVEGLGITEVKGNYVDIEDLEDGFYYYVPYAISNPVLYAKRNNIDIEAIYCEGVTLDFQQIEEMIEGDIQNHFKSIVTSITGSETHFSDGSWINRELGEYTIQNENGEYVSYNLLEELDEIINILTSKL